MKYYVFEKRIKFNLYWFGEFIWGMMSCVIFVFYSGCVIWYKEIVFLIVEGIVAFVYLYKKGIYICNDFDIICRGI